MAIDVETLAVAKSYTDKSIEGVGIIKGKNCTIKDISPITGGNRVTFNWETDSGISEEDYMDVMDGQDGQPGTNGRDGTDGVGISSITFKEVDQSGNDVYTITLSNGDHSDIVCPKGPQGSTGQYTKVAESAANKTFATQIGELKTAFDSLTDAQKLSAKIVLSNGAIYEQAATGGVFTYIRVAGDFVVGTLNMLDSTYKSCTNSFTINNGSSSTDANSMQLWALM